MPLPEEERDRLLIETHADVRHIKSSISDQETRLRGVEKWQNKTIGAFGIICVAIGAFWTAATVVITALLKS